MLDIKFIRKNLDTCRKAAKNKNRPVDWDKLLKLDDKRRKLIEKVDKFRAERNILAKANTDESRIKGKALKDEMRVYEKDLKRVLLEYEDIMLQVPNVIDETVPIGKDERSNKEVRKWGKLPKFDFKPKDHIALAKKHDLIDFDKGVKVAGFRGYFLKNEGAHIELTLMHYVFTKLIKKGFTPLIAPSIVKEFTLFGSGQFPWGRDDVYNLEKHDKYLAGTAEVPVTAYFSDETLKEEDLPKKFVAFSKCFRGEAGSYGKDTKGIYRLHEFNKIEQVVIGKNDLNDSHKLHEELQENCEEILQELELPYRVVVMSTGEMGEPQFKKYDTEVFMPSRDAYGETMSNSIMTDFQARRLNIRYKTKEGQVRFVHTLNNTAIASPRILIPLFEINQNKNGSIKVPQVLKEFLGKDIIG